MREDGGRSLEPANAISEYTEKRTPLTTWNVPFTAQQQSQDSIGTGYRTPCRLAGSEVTSEDTTSRADQDHLVDWNGPEDPNDPQNWSDKKKWTIIILISVVTFNQAMSSTIFAPGVPQAMEDLHSDNHTLSSLLVSIYVIGLAVGPLFLAPLSEMYGRLPLMHATNLVFMLAAVACALSVNVAMLLVFRLIMGVSTISLGGGYVADLMEPARRGKAMNLWTVGPVLAPVVGPIVGGYMSLKTSWRWTFWLVAILGILSIISCFLLLPETYPARILELKARRLRKETGNQQLRSKFDTSQRPGKLFRLSIMRPTRMLIRCPIVGLVSLLLAIAYSYMYFMFTTFTDVFETTYGFNAGEAGLCYIGLGVGSLAGQYSLNMLTDRKIKKQADNGRSLEPEHQLPPLLAAGFLMSAGLFCYGWSLEYKVHWIIPILGTFLCGVSISFSFLAVQTYLIEAYTGFAASVLAASTLIRCIFGLTIPLASTRLYDSLGLGWGNTLLGFLALLVIPATLWLLRYGKMVRTHPRFVFEL